MPIDELCSPIFVTNKSLVKVSLVVAGLAGLLTHASEVPSIAAADLSTNASRVVILDVRYNVDYRRGHIKGALSAPYFGLDKVDLPKDRPIVTYCSGIGCLLSKEAAVKLTEMGYTNVRYLLGGIAEWELKGYPIVREAVDVKPAGPGIFEGGDVAAPLVSKNLKRLYVLDVRPQPEFEAGHLPGAWNIPLERLGEGMGELSGEVIVCDRQPKRWKRAVQILKEAGYDAHGLSGGVGAWAGSGFPLVTGAAGL